jgi:tetratricopeptide (TPR) repeat protein
LLEFKGDLDGAISTYLEAERHLTSKNHEHPGLPPILSNLGPLYQDIGEMELAEEKIRRAITISDARNPDDPDRWYFVRNLVSLLVETRQMDEAESLLDDLEAAFNDKQNLDAWRRYDVQSLRGAIFASKGAYLVAEELLLDSYENMVAAEPQALARNQRQAIDRIVRLYETWGNAQEAAKWRRRRDAPKVKIVETET